MSSSYFDGCCLDANGNRYDQVQYKGSSGDKAGCETACLASNVCQGFFIRHGYGYDYCNMAIENGEMGTFTSSAVCSPGAICTSSTTTNNGAGPVGGAASLCSGWRCYRKE